MIQIDSFLFGRGRNHSSLKIFVFLRSEVLEQREVQRVRACKPDEKAPVGFGAGRERWQALAECEVG